MNSNDLTEKFVQEIKRRILEKEYKIGSNIPPLRELAEEFGCSRSVINVGIAKLQTQGYLEIRKRQKTIINDFLLQGSLDTIKDMTVCNNKEYRDKSISDMLSARMFIELEAIKLASRSNNFEEIEKLKSIVNNEIILIDSNENDTDVIAHADGKFHRQIIKMSENIIYLFVINALEDIAFYMTKKYYEYNRKFFIENVKVHKEICEKLQNRQTKEAMILLKDILSKGEKAFKKINNIK